MESAPAKHTPGPWEWDGHALMPVAHDPDQHNVHTVLTVEFSGWGFTGADLKKVSEEDAANRDLIATAPELLKAARLVYAEMSKAGEISPITWELLEAAIDKAMGEA